MEEVTLIHYMFSFSLTPSHHNYTPKKIYIYTNELISLKLRPQKSHYTLVFHKIEEKHFLLFYYKEISYYTHTYFLVGFPIINID